MLMDGQTLDRYAALGVGRDTTGEPLRRRATDLTSLTEPERAAYYALTTAGEVAVRRVEQERIPLTDAVAHACALTGRGPQPRA
nr:Wadjet anti-phage system protein JetD domain-containing protein [Cellulomonas sp.]